MRLKVHKPHYLRAYRKDNIPNPWIVDMQALDPSGTVVWFPVNTFETWKLAINSTEHYYQKYWKMGYR